jgi:hypothetical protein
MIHRGHHAPVRGQFRMPGSLLESMGGSVLGSPAISVQVKVRFVARRLRGQRHKAEPDGAVD